jgi:hypothetical protein
LKAKGVMAIDETSIWPKSEMMWMFNCVVPQFDDFYTLAKDWQ